MFKKIQSSKSPFSSILMIDPYENRYSIVKNNSIELIPKPSYSDNQFVSSFISNKDLLIASINMSRRIPDEDMASAIEIKIQEELGISEEESENLIGYIESESATDERLFHVFTTKSEENYTLFENHKKNIKYIDLIAPAPLLCKTLYTNNALSSNEVHIFIYLMHKDAFIAIYKDGNFMYSKNLDYSIDKLHDKYCEAIGNHIERGSFLELLLKDNLYGIDTNVSQSLAKIFGSFFLSVNDVIVYSKRALKIEVIDKIFIGSDIGDIPLCHKYILNYIGTNSEIWDFGLGFTYNNNTKSTPLELMLAKTSIDYVDDKNSMVNLTQFQRPPSFAQRTGGKFLIAAGVASVIGLSMPLYYLLYSYINDIQSYSNTRTSEELAPQVENYKKAISEKENELKILGVEENAKREAYNSKAQTLDSIFNKKVNYTMKSKIFYDLSNDLKKFGVTIEKFQNKDNNFSIGLVGDNDKKITEFIKFISEKNINIQNINMKLLEKDQNGSFYQGVLTMELK
ncbi:MAG: hypothetical protein PHI79_01510 [Sulfurovaceae bacterium]|nr:hypothetical protein [Sulfurovaceae bacterium]MDD5548253.1 hypothetical protein [Sulfurovaceae bacterium]